LGGPLNKFESELLGKIENSDLDNTITSVTKEAVVPGAGNNIGQKKAEGQSGTTKVPPAGS